MPEEQVPEVSKESGEPVPASSESVPEPEIAPVGPENVQEKGGERIEGKYLEILHKAPSGQAPVQAQDEEIAGTAKNIGALPDEEAKVVRLLELAEQKGVAQAVKVAYALKDYYVLDRMHDELADKLYEGLKAKGLVKSE